MAPAAFCLQTLEGQPPGKLSAREPSMLVNFGDMQDRIAFVARDQIPRIGFELVFDSFNQAKRTVKLHGHFASHCEP